MKCRLFIDEIGNADLKGSSDPNIRYLSLTGIIAKVHHHDTRIQPAIDAFKADLFGHSDERPVILHRREIMRREGPFAELRYPWTQAAFDAGLLELVDRLPYLVTTVVIDKQAHLQKYNTWYFDPYHYCMRCILERYVLWLRRHDYIGDVIIEPRFKKVDKKLKASFQRTYDNGTENIPARIIQKHLTSRDLKFSPKAENMAGLQLADLIAYPSYKATRNAYLKVEQPLDYGKQIVDILERKKYSRNPKTGEIDGWGRKWLP